MGYKLDLKKFTLIDEENWNKIVNDFVNHDELVTKKEAQEGFGKPYYLAIINYASRVAYLAERMIEYRYMEDNEEIFKVARKYAFYDMLDEYEVSSFQGDIAIGYLKQYWKYGELL